MNKEQSSIEGPQKRKACPPAIFGPAKEPVEAEPAKKKKMPRRKPAVMPPDTNET